MHANYRKLSLQIINKCKDMNVSLVACYILIMKTAINEAIKINAFMIFNNAKQYFLYKILTFLKIVISIVGHIKYIKLIRATINKSVITIFAILYRISSETPFKLINTSKNNICEDNKHSKNFMLYSFRLEFHHE